MPRIPDDDLERLKQNTSLAELCRSRGIELKAHGRKDLIGKCPFHDEADPSFIVTPDKNLFHCMGCDAAGSVIDFVMKLDGLDFRQAVDKLIGSTPKVRRAAAPDLSRRNEVEPERAAQLLERVAAIYAKTFGDAPEGRAYLEGRGISDAGLLTQHRAGYCNGRLTDILPNDGQLKEELRTLGILLDEDAERFAGCVVFPVCDVDGNLVTLYGRSTLNGPKRHVFLSNRPTGLWNAAAVKMHADLILVESIIDALSVMAAGSPNVLGIQGTNGLSDEDIALLREHGVQKITLLLDGDDAGRKAAERLKGKLSSFSCRLLSLPDDHDPNSYLVECGPEKLAALLADAPHEEPKATPPAANGHALTCGARRYDIHGLEKSPHRLKVTLRVEHAGKLHVDTLDLYAARWRKTLAMDLCRVFDETPETIEADLSKLVRHCEGMNERTDDGGRTTAAQPMTAKEKEEAERFGRDPKILDAILADYEACGLIGERANKLLGYLAMTSRKTDEPLSVLVLSSSGAGKTALQDTALNFCPPEDLVKLTSLSGKALFYKEQLSLKHKALALEEGAGAEEATYAIRNLISAGELVIESAIKDPASGKITTMVNRVEGPTAVFITTTDPATDPETKSRFFVTSIDESREQTRAILAFQRKRQTLEGLADHARVDAVLAKHRNFQRLLKPLAVINPFAGQLAYGDDRLQGRRDQPKYLNLIKAVAFLRQMQKQVQTFGNNGSSFAYVEVDREDLRIADELARELLGHSLDELSRPSRDLLLQLEAMTKQKTEKSASSFSRRDIRAFTGWSNYRVHTHLKELIELEYLAMEPDRLTNSHRYRLLYDGQGKNGERFVLGLPAV